MHENEISEKIIGAAIELDSAEFSSIPRLL
jgi:hypothetical protein